MNAARLVPLDALRFDPGLSPRDRLSQERIDLFAELYREGGPNALPPLKGIQHGDTFLIGDGGHRLNAAKAAGLTELPVLVVAPPQGVDPKQYAHQVAVEEASRGPLPLSRKERNRAIAALLQELLSGRRPDLTRRKIAEVVGVSHDTVNRIAREMDESSDDEARASDDAYLSRSIDEVARSVVRSLSRLWESRGLIEIVAGDRRIGRKLADALLAVHDEAEALVWARRLANWGTEAMEALRRTDGEARPDSSVGNATPENKNRPN